MKRPISDDQLHTFLLEAEAMNSRPLRESSHCPLLKVTEVFSDVYGVVRVATVKWKGERLGDLVINCAHSHNDTVKRKYLVVTTSYLVVMTYNGIRVECDCIELVCRTGSWTGVKLGRSGPELRPKVIHKGGARAPAVVWASKSKSGWNYILQL